MENQNTPAQNRKGRRLIRKGQKLHAPVHKKPSNLKISRKHTSRFNRHEAKKKLRVLQVGDFCKHTRPAGPLVFTPQNALLEKMSCCNHKKTNNKVFDRTVAA